MPGCGSKALDWIAEWTRCAVRLIHDTRLMSVLIDASWSDWKMWCYVERTRREREAPRPAAVEICAGSRNRMLASTTRHAQPRGRA